jgi:hypothetical protein
MWALALILPRTQRVADEALNRALDCSMVLPAFRVQKPLIYEGRGHATDRIEFSAVSVRSRQSASISFSIQPRISPAGPFAFNLTHGISTRRPFHPAKTSISRQNGQRERRIGAKRNGDNTGRQKPDHDLRPED